MTETGKAGRVRNMFDGIAGRYDLLNRVLSLGLDSVWRREAVREALGKSPADILDVATGTGDLAFGLARRAPFARVTGLDFSSEMLAVAQRKAKDRPPVEFTQGDAQELPFDDASFDTVTIAYGLRNLDEPSRGLSEFHRVLRPGGRLVVLEFPPPPGGVWGSLVRFHFKTIMPVVGGLISGDRQAYTYLPESVMAFTEPPVLAGLMADAGFAAVRFRKQFPGVSAVHVAEKAAVDSDSDSAQEAAND